MIIEFELLGSKGLHKGIMDTTGFWVKYEESIEDGLQKWGDDGRAVVKPDGYKIFSHFSFSYYHTDKTVVDLVYSKLVAVLRGANNVDVEGIGFFRKLNK